MMHLKCIYIQSGVDGLMCCVMDVFCVSLLLVFGKG